MLPPGGRGQADHAALPRQRPAADGDPLVHQRGLRDPPAIADAADPVGVGDACVGEEHLVELGLVGELAQRADLDAGPGHVQAEVGEAGVLGHVRVGAGEQQAPARRVRDGRPHLLPGDPPVLTVGGTDRPGREARQVGAGARLAEQLAPHLLAGPQRPQPALLLFLGAEREDRGAAMPRPMPIRAGLLSGAPAARASASTAACSERGSPCPPSPAG
jgi:hypothetical protein